MMRCMGNVSHNIYLHSLLYKASHIASMDGGVPRSHSSNPGYTQRG